MRVEGGGSRFEVLGMRVEGAEVPVHGTKWAAGCSVGEPLFNKVALLCLCRTKVHIRAKQNAQWPPPLRVVFATLPGRVGEGEGFGAEG